MNKTLLKRYPIKFEDDIIPKDIFDLIGYLFERNPRDYHIKNKTYSTFRNKLIMPTNGSMNGRSREDCYLLAKYYFPNEYSFEDITRILNANSPLNNTSNVFSRWLCSVCGKIIYCTGNYRLNHNEISKQVKENYEKI